MERQWDHNVIDDGNNINIYYDNVNDRMITYILFWLLWISLYDPQKFGNNLSPPPPSPPLVLIVTYVLQKRHIYITF